jgi:peptidoglycan/xylan/chitin deacetylase (PgdA/CDA1 family)
MLLQASGPFTIKIGEAGIAMGPIAPSHLHARWWDLVEQLSAFDGESRERFLVRIREQLNLQESWKERILGDPKLAARFLVLDRAGLLQMIAAGMSVGAHSLSHPVLAKTSDELAWREISGSRKVLEDVLGRAVWAFGYPFGNAETVTWRDLRLAEEAGFRCAFMNTGGGFGAKVKPFAVPRVHVTADMSLGEFEAHISGLFRSLRETFLGEGEIDAIVGS